MTAGAQIVGDFVSDLRKYGLDVAPTGVSPNVWKVTGSVGSHEVNCLLYVKGRGQAPYKWGVTANVIDCLTGQTLPWDTVLIYESKHTGYFLTSDDVHYFTQGKDGDYKPAGGSYLDGATQFFSFSAFLELMQGTR